jgi:integrase
MRGLCKRAKIRRNYGFHEIRHFIATYLHDIEKQPTGATGNLLGHKSKRTTEIYLHPIDGAAKMEIQKLDGGFTLEELPDVSQKSKTTHRTHTPRKVQTL